MTAAANDRKGSRRQTPVEIFVIPDKLQTHIECQRHRLVRAITLAYCLHSVLRWRLEDPRPIDNIVVEDATRWAELPVITEMLLECIHSAHRGLDSTALLRAMRGPL